MRLLSTAAVAFSLVGAVGLQSPLAQTAPPYCSIDVSTDHQVCAPTEAGMIAARDAAQTSRATMFVLAKLYDQANRTGPYLEIRAPGACDTNADVDWTTAYVGSTWNDRVSSFQGFSNCQIRIYENANFTGASYGAYTSSNYVGDAMNDRTSSARYY